MLFNSEAVAAAGFELHSPRRGKSPWLLAVPAGNIPAQEAAVWISGRCFSHPVANDHLMERVLQGHRVLGRKPPSPGCAWLPGSLEVTWEDAGVTQTLAAGGMTSPGTAKHARCGRGRSFTSPLCREHHKPRISRMWRGQGDYVHITRKDKEREIFFSVHPTVESLNDKIENLQNREMVLLFYVFL